MLVPLGLDKTDVLLQIWLVCNLRPDELSLLNDTKGQKEKGPFGPFQVCLERDDTKETYELLAIPVFSGA